MDVFGARTLGSVLEKRTLDECRESKRKNQLGDGRVQDGEGVEKVLLGGV